MASQKKSSAATDKGLSGKTAWVDDGEVFIRKVGTPVYVKTADFARMIGKANQWVGQLVAQGTIVRSDTAHGSLIELGEGFRAYAQYLEARNAERKEDKFDLEKRKAESALKKAKATTALLYANELRGKMHRASDVEKMTTDLLMAVRGILLALPGRLATVLAPEMSPVAVSELIKAECESAMQEISEYKYDPKKYSESVRERLRWDAVDGDGDEGEDENEDG